MRIARSPKAPAASSSRRVSVRRLFRFIMPVLLDCVEVDGSLLTY